MKEHTSDFKDQIKEMGREIESIAICNEQQLELFDVKYSFEGNILKSVMKQLIIECTEELEKGDIINYKMGLKVENNFEYIDYGNYIVKDIEKLEDTDHYRITCYDKLLNSMINYEPVDVQYPITIRDYISAICNDLEIDFANASDEFANYDRVLLVDPYEGLEYTYRDVLDELAQVTASTICINVDDELEIRYIEDKYITDKEEDVFYAIIHPNIQKPLEIKIKGNSTQETTTGKNLIEDTLTGMTINSSGIITGTSSNNLVVAKITQGKQYVISGNGLTQPHVFGYFTNKPTAIGDTSYDNARYVLSVTTFTAPITRLCCI